MPLPVKDGEGMLQSFDANSSLFDQLKLESTGPIVLVNVFIVPEGKIDETLEVWHHDALIMKAQKGFISAQMHQGVESNILVNVAVWADVEGLRNGILSKDFQDNLRRYPAGTVAYPHVCRKVAVSDICIA